MKNQKKCKQFKALKLKQMLMWQICFCQAKSPGLVFFFFFNRRLLPWSPVHTVHGSPLPLIIELWIMLVFINSESNPVVRKAASSLRTLDSIRPQHCLWMSLTVSMIWMADNFLGSDPVVLFIPREHWSRVRWHTLAVPSRRGMNGGSEDSLGFVLKPCLSKAKQNTDPRHKIQLLLELGTEM